MEYCLHLLVLFLVYAELAVLLQLLIGYAGLFSVAQAGIFGLGAYGTVLAERRLGLPVALGIGCGAALGGSACLALSCLVRRLRREEFFLASLALQVSVVAALTNAEGLTGGALGLSQIPPYFPTPLAQKVGAAFLAGFMLLVTLWLLGRVVSSPLGRVLRAGRENEPAALACGKDVGAARTRVLVLAGLLSGAVGGVYAHYVTAIDPGSFSLGESILLVSIVVVGGAERIASTVAAALLLTLLPEAFRYLPLPSGSGQVLRQLLFGAVFLVVVLYQPEGLLRVGRRRDGLPIGASE